MISENRGRGAFFKPPLPSGGHWPRSFGSQGGLEQQLAESSVVAMIIVETRLPVMATSPASAAMDARWTVKFSKAKPKDDGAPQIDIAIP